MWAVGIEGRAEDMTVKQLKGAATFIKAEIKGNKQQLLASVQKKWADDKKELDTKWKKEMRAMKGVGPVTFGRFCAANENDYRVSTATKDVMVAQGVTFKDLCIASLKVCILKIIPKVVYFFFPKFFTKHTEE